MSPAEKSFRRVALSVIAAMTAILGTLWFLKAREEHMAEQEAEARTARESLAQQQWLTAENARVAEVERRAFDSMTPDQHVEAAVKALGEPASGLTGVPEAQRHLDQVSQDAGAAWRRVAVVRRTIAEREQAARAEEERRRGGGPGLWVPSGRWSRRRRGW